MVHKVLSGAVASTKAKPKVLKQKPAKKPEEKIRKQLIRFCPSCGANTNELFEGFCRKCFLSNVELIRAAKRVQFGICYDCGRVRLNKFWQAFGNKNEIVHSMAMRHAKALRGAELRLDYHDFTVKGKTEVPVILTAEIESNSNKISKSKEMMLVIIPEICPDCSRLRGGYYEGIIQLRGENQDGMLKHIEDNFSKYDKSEPNAFISKIERLSEGLDIYIGSRTAGIKVSSEIRKLYNVDCTITHKIHGMRQGKEIRRTTILLRGVPAKRQAAAEPEPEAEESELESETEE